MTRINAENNPMRTIILTDANYGNAIHVRADHITACTIVSETTYRDGKIPDGVFRRTFIYTIGGSQLAVRESPEEVWAKVGRQP